MSMNHLSTLPPKEFTLSEAWDSVGVEQTISGDHSANLCMAIALTEIDRMDVASGQKMDALKAILQAWEYWLDEGAAEPKVEYARSFVAVRYPEPGPYPEPGAE